jgi:hypothetical protein
MIAGRGRLADSPALRSGVKTNIFRSQVICPSGCFLTGVSSRFSGFPKNISVPI